MARSFSGTNGINIGTHAPLPNQATAVPFSVSSWAFPTSSTTDGIIFGANGVGGEIIELRFDRASDGFVSFNCVNQGSILGRSVSTSTTASLLNSWFSVVATWDGSHIIIYINGTQQNSTAFAGTGLTTGVGNAIWGIGRDIANAGNTFVGSLADCAVWTATLTAGEASALGQGALPGQIRNSSLVGWWQVDGLQSPEPDLSGNHNNGTVTGTALAAGPPVMMITPRWPMGSILPAGAAATAVFRRSLSGLGTRTGSRQVQGAF